MQTVLFIFSIISFVASLFFGFSVYGDVQSDPVNVRYHVRRLSMMFAILTVIFIAGFVFLDKF